MRRIILSMIVIILSMIVIILSIGISNAIQVISHNTKENESQCSGAWVNKVYYIPNGNNSYVSKFIYDAFWANTDRYIAKNTTVVSIWSSDSNLFNCSGWNRLSEVAPGNNTRVVALGSNCTFYKPTNKNNRELQFVFRIKHGAVTTDGSSTRTKIYRIIQNGSIVDRTKTYNNYYVKDYIVHNDECLNIELRYCGDGVVDTSYGEQCDDGNNVNGDGCSATCQNETPNTPSCGNANGQTYDASTTNWPAGTTFCTVGTSNPPNPVFPAQGGSTSWTCNEGGASVNCSASRESTTPTPSCGNANGQTYDASTTNWPAGTTFCTVGTSNPPNPAFPAQGGSTSWTCNEGGASVNCSASRESAGGGGGGGGGWYYYCGDGHRITENNLWQGPFEECDAGRNNNGNETYKISPDWDSIINYYITNGLTGRAEELEQMKGKDVYCSSSCKIVPIETPCAVDGTCSTGTCGPLNGNILTRSQYSTILRYINNLGTYADKFCQPADTILSYSVNQTLGASEFVWYCGTTRCSMPIETPGTGFIKVYGSYKNAWSCPECLGFDEEYFIDGGNETIKKMLTSYDTEYTRSIMQGDYLPIGFKLKGSNYITLTASGVPTCDASIEGKRDFTNFNVEFKIDGNTKPFVVGTLKAFPDQSVMGQAYLPASETASLTPGLHAITGILKKIRVCKGFDTDGDGTKDDYRWIEESMNEQFASQTFTVTTNYMIQAGTALSNVSNVDPNIDGKSLSTWGVPVASTTTSYNKTQLQSAISGFVAKYKQYATLPNNELFVDHTIPWKKVSTQEVYYIDASTQGGFVKIWGSVSKPTTVIVENGKAIIEGDISGPLMLVVKGGDIEINNENMNKRTFMEGYYFTDGEIKVVGPAITLGQILNKNPNSPIWYADGRLVVKGVLIGTNTDKVYQKRRSVLKNRFRSGFGPNYAVRNSASLTIIPSTTLWANPPEGSKDLFQMLNISRGN